MDVTIVSCKYGDGWEPFLETWVDSILDMQPPPADVILEGGFVCPWKHPQAYWLNKAIGQAETEWVWILDLDDTARPDALVWIDDVEADVWMMGYMRSDGEVYIPPPMTAEQILVATTSLVPGASAIRTDVFKDAGGFQDLAFQDWELWRRLARMGATFAPSGRVHYNYRRHPMTRSETELTPDRRAHHIAEMLEAEHASV